MCGHTVAAPAESAMMPVENAEEPGTQRRPVALPSRLDRR